MPVITLVVYNSYINRDFNYIYNGYVWYQNLLISLVCFHDENKCSIFVHTPLCRIKIRLQDKNIKSIVIYYLEGNSSWKSEAVALWTFGRTIIIIHEINTLFNYLDHIRSYNYCTHILQQPDTFLSGIYHRKYHWKIQIITWQVVLITIFWCLTA